MSLTREILTRLDSMERKVYLSQKDVLTLEECALYTGLAKGTITNKVCKLEIPHYKNEKQLYFDRKEINEWMKKKSFATIEDIETTATNHRRKVTTL